MARRFVGTGRPPRLLFCAVVVFAAALRADTYTLGPDSQPQPGVPQETPTHRSWTSKIFPGTTLDYWDSVPARYDGSKPVCVMVFKDGGGFFSEKGAWSAPVVFDNSIHDGAIPLTIGIFINPGALPAPSPTHQGRFNRSYECDGLGNRYARFLMEESFSELAKDYKLSGDPNDPANAGSSSGGIVAFTVAWERPDFCHRVISFIRSFTDLRGGELYPSPIRQAEPLPLGVFLQDGYKDRRRIATAACSSSTSPTSAFTSSTQGAKRPSLRKTPGRRAA